MRSVETVRRQGR